MRLNDHEQLIGNRFTSKLALSRVSDSFLQILANKKVLFCMERCSRTSTRGPVSKPALTWFEHTSSTCCLQEDECSGCFQMKVQDKFQNMDALIKGLLNRWLLDTQTALHKRMDAFRLFTDSSPSDKAGSIMETTHIIVSNNLHDLHSCPDNGNCKQWKRRCGADTQP